MAQKRSTAYLREANIGARPFVADALANIVRIVEPKRFLRD